MYEAAEYVEYMFKSMFYAKSMVIVLTSIIVTYKATQARYKMCMSYTAYDVVSVMYS